MQLERQMSRWNDALHRADSDFVVERAGELWRLRRSGSIFSLHVVFRVSENPSVGLRGMLALPGENLAHALDIEFERWKDDVWEPPRLGAVPFDHLA
jgi:hypothetical protein